MHGEGGEFRIRHREMITQVYYTGNANAVQSTMWYLQPGDGGTFPWMHSIASCFQEYTIEGAAYYFKSLVTPLFSNTAMTAGQVVLATDYNVCRPTYTAKPFASFSEAENTQYTTVAKLQSSLYHPIECAPGMTVNDKKWIRTSTTLPAGADPRLYDFCKTQLMISCPLSGAATPILVGEMWITYDITLRKPLYDPNVDQETDFFDLKCPSAQTNPVAILYSSPMTGSSLGGTIGNGYYQFPDSVQTGTYLVYIWFTWNAALAAGITSVVTYTNCSVVTPFTGGPGGFESTLTGSYTRSIIVNVDAPQARITWANWSAAPTQNGNGGLIITALDSDITYPQNPIPNI